MPEGRNAEEERRCYVWEADWNTQHCEKIKLDMDKAKFNLKSCIHTVRSHWMFSLLMEKASSSI